MSFLLFTTPFTSKDKSRSVTSIFFNISSDRSQVESEYSLYFLSDIFILLLPLGQQYKNIITYGRAFVKYPSTILCKISMNTVVCGAVRQLRCSKHIAYAIFYEGGNYVAYLSCRAAF